MKITRPPAPWLNAEDIKQLQSERNKLRHLAHATKKDSIWQLFRGIRNKIKTRIKEAKRSFYRKALSSRKPKDLWRTIHRILHPSQQKISADSNVLNHHFSTTSQRLLGTSPSSSDDLRNLINTFPDNTNHSFTLRPATFREVLNEIKGLRSDCSTGTDQIPVKYIKLAADWIASPLTHIINHYISNNSFPKIWKLARVSPIPKTDHPVELDDFRPIAILPALSKIYEHLVLKQLLLYIEDHNILHSGMSGYRKGHSTNSVLLRIRDDIIRAMKKGEVTLIAFADFSKAFDTVEYATVFKKLHNVGFSHDAIYWVLNYLAGRKQYVQIDEKQSQVVDVQFGVPQGSILGPVLFNLYVNDLEPDLECSCYQYADDTTLYRHSVPSKIHECAKKLQDAMTVLENWAVESNLALNETKTKQMLITTSKMSRVHGLDTVVPDIRVKAQTLEKVEEFKLLGTWESAKKGESSSENEVESQSVSNLESLEELPNQPTGPSETVETEILRFSNTRVKSTQTSTKKPAKRTVRTQTLMTSTSTFFQTPAATRSVETQMLTTSDLTCAMEMEYSTTSPSPASGAQPVDSVTLTMPDNVTTIRADSTQTTVTEVDMESVKSSSSSTAETVTLHSDLNVPIKTSSTESDESSEEDIDSEKRTILMHGKPPQEQVKFIVFEEAILDIFGKCAQCGAKCIVTMENQIGSSCSSCTTKAEHSFEWSTAPSLFKMPAFHLLLASGILATGMESSKVLRLFNALNIPNLQQRELSNILKNYVIPAVYEVWQEEQSARLREIQGHEIVIASDMRVDSPGHSGVFGSGSTLNMGRNVVLDTQVIKSTEVKNSNAMELESLKRQLKYLEDNRVEVNKLVTDRHIQVSAYMANEKREVEHSYDVWHVAKGSAAYKKLEEMLTRPRLIAAILLDCTAQTCTTTKIATGNFTLEAICSFTATRIYTKITIQYTSFTWPWKPLKIYIHLKARLNIYYNFLRISSKMADEVYIFEKKRDFENQVERIFHELSRIE
ncbi:Hypothetical predicted protein, partial [Paramuricea clavata]